MLVFFLKHTDCNEIQKSLSFIGEAYDNAIGNYHGKTYVLGVYFSQYSFFKNENVYSRAVSTANKSILKPLQYYVLYLSIYYCSCYYLQTMATTPTKKSFFICFFFCSFVVLQKFSTTFCILFVYWAY